MELLQIHFSLNVARAASRQFDALGEIPIKKKDFDNPYIL